MSGNRTPTLSELVDDHIEVALEQLRVAQPGRVESFDAASARAAVTPLLRRPVHGSDGQVSWISLPRSESVPVLMPMAGGRRIKLPVQEGDIVLLVFCDFNIDDWKAGAGAADPNGIVQPATLGTHQVGDAIAIAGLLNPVGGAHSDAIELKADGTVLLGAGASHPLIFGDDFSDAGGAFATLMNAVATAVGTSGTPAGAAAAAGAITAALAAYHASVLAKLSGNKTA